jgi:hypothetical protein
MTLLDPNRPECGSMTGGSGIDDFLREQFRRTEGAIYFCALRNNKSKLPPGEVAHIITRDLNEIEGFRDKWDRPEHECGIYYHAATLKRGASHRIKQNCHHFIALFGDIDDPNHELSRDMARALLEQAEYPPTLIVDSGHGLQGYWLLTEPCTDAAAECGPNGAPVQPNTMLPIRTKTGGRSPQTRCCGRIRNSRRCVTAPICSRATAAAMAATIS